MVLTALFAAGGGSPWWAASYLAGTAVVSLTGVLAMPRGIGWRPAWTGNAQW
jgi:hypothetical protein